MSRGFASSWLYPPVKAMKFPAWMESELRAYARTAEVRRFRDECRALAADLEVYRAPTGRPTNQARKAQQKLQKRAAKRR